MILEIVSFTLFILLNMNMLIFVTPPPSLHFHCICSLQVATDHIGQEPKGQVLCSLQYWSDCRACYLPYAQFQLSESEMYRLELPTSPHKVNLQKNASRCLACLPKKNLSSSA